MGKVVGVIDNFLELFAPKPKSRPKSKKRNYCERCETCYDGPKRDLCRDCSCELKLMGIEIERANHVDFV